MIYLCLMYVTSQHTKKKRWISVGRGGFLDGVFDFRHCSVKGRLLSGGAHTKSKSSGNINNIIISISIGFNERDERKISRSQCNVFA